jgi:hypothetical protein
MIVSVDIATAITRWSHLSEQTHGCSSVRGWEQLTGVGWQRNHRNCSSNTGRQAAMPLGDATAVLTDLKRLPHSSVQLCSPDRPDVSKHFDS